jgi:hypothetical protein
MKNLNDEELLLNFLSKNAVSIFSEMKRFRVEVFKEKFEDINGYSSILSEILKDFYLFFKKKTSDSISYFVFYYFFQSYYFSDPENFFMYDEDFIQTLIVNSFISFDRMLRKYYSKKNLEKMDYAISINTFIARNFSRVMVFEFKNMKRVMETEVKKPCSFYSNISESISNLPDLGYFDSDFSFNIESLNKIYGTDI